MNLPGREAHKALTPSPCMPLMFSRQYLNFVGFGKLLFGLPRYKIQVGLVTNSIAELAPEFLFRYKCFVKKCRYDKNKLDIIATPIILLKYLRKRES